MRNRSIFFRFTAVILAISMLLPVFASCKKQDDFPGYPEPIETNYPTVEIEGTFTTGDANPVMHLRIDELIMAPLLSAMQADEMMISMDGAFRDLTVTGYAQTDRGIRLETEGTVCISPSEQGVITFKPLSADGMQDISAYTYVATRDAYIDPTSYRFTEDGVICKVVLSSDTFQDNAPTVTVSDHTVEIDKVAEDKASAILYIPLKNKNTDEGIANLHGQTLHIDKNSLTSGIEQNMEILLSPAQPTVHVDYVKKTENGCQAELALYSKNGDFLNLTKDSFAFFGDFLDAEVVSLEESKNKSYQLVIAFPYTEDSDTFSLNGEMVFAKNQLQNHWNTTNEKEISLPLSYASIDDRGEKWDAFVALLEAHKDTLDTLGSIGSTISGVTSVVGGVTSILELCGVLESTDAKADKIYKAVTEIKEEITALSRDLHIMNEEMSAKFLDAKLLAQKTMVSVSQNGWDGFVSKYLQPLTKIQDEYKHAYNRGVLTFILNYPTYELTVYTDDTGNITFPSPYSEDGSVSIEGKHIVSAEKTLWSEKFSNANLEPIKEKIEKNGNRVYESVTDDLKACLMKVTDEKTASDYVNALIVKISFQAINEVGPVNIVNAFQNFCYALSGSTDGLAPEPFVKTPVEHYRNMVSGYYIFESEALPKFEIICNYLNALMIEMRSLATLAYTYDTSFAVRDLDTPWEWAKKETNKFLAKHPDVMIPNPNGYPEPKDTNSKYCYVTNGYVNLEVANVVTKMPPQHVNADEYTIMMARWNLMKSVDDVFDTFYDYYMSHFSYSVTEYTPADFEKEDNIWYFLTDRKGGLPKDGTVKGKICSIHAGTWFKKGDILYYGRTNGKLNPDRFWVNDGINFTNTLFDAKTGKIKTGYCGFFNYSEDHWYWTNAEVYSVQIVSDIPDVLFMSVKS